MMSSMFFASASPTSMTFPMIFSVSLIMMLFAVFLVPSPAAMGNAVPAAVF